MNPPGAWAATIDPRIATPRVLPTWRPVEASAADTPARAGGRPVTAVLVIGVLTTPMPAPNNTYPSSSTGSGVAGVTEISVSAAAAIRPPAAISGARAPYRAVTRPEIGAVSTVAPAIGRVSSPACSAL